MGHTVFCTSFSCEILVDSMLARRLALEKFRGLQEIVKQNLLVFGFLAPPTKWLRQQA
jgi:hypothetical protein